MLFISVLSTVAFFFSLFFHSRQALHFLVMALKKENEILKRTLELRGKKPVFSFLDRFFITLFYKLSDRVRKFLSIVSPETVLKWYRAIIKKNWTFPGKPPGRPSIPASTRNLIAQIKNGNIFMGAGKIQGELIKLGIDLSLSTIRRILARLRGEGKIKKGISWTKFIKSHLSSLHAMDFLTVDSIFGKRFFVFFILCVKTRKIIQFGVTENPNRSFVRNQLFAFVEEREGHETYLIHDRSGEFMEQNYSGFGITSVPTSSFAPNMNAHAERFVGSLRREALDWFVIFNYGQLYRIVQEYVMYYNSLRPHQGIDQGVPDGYVPQTEGKIVSMPVLDGLWRHYYRIAS